MPSSNPTRRGRPTQSELELRKRRVLQIAEKLFMTRGYDGTSVSEISKRSHVTPRLIAAHFGDKSEIFSAVINERSSRAFTRAMDAITGTTLEEILFGAAKFAWEIAYAPHAVDFQRLIVGEGARFSLQTSRIAGEASAFFFAEMESIFQTASEMGLVPPGQQARMAKFFVDLVVGFSLIQAGMGYWDRVPDDDELRDKVRFFCRSISFFEEASTLSEPGDISCVES